MPKHNLSIEVLLENQGGTIVPNNAIIEVLSVEGKEYAVCSDLNKQITFLSIVYTENGEEELRDITDQAEFNRVQAYYLEKSRSKKD